MSCDGTSRRSFVKSAIPAVSGILATVATNATVKAAEPASSDHLTQLSLTEAADLVRRKKVSALELTRACLARIERLNPALNCFITVTPDAALAQAREAEAEIQRGKYRGSLHGIPIALKDLFDTAGIKTTAGSALYKDRVPPQDAEVGRRLKEAGAVLVGKTNMVEFAYGSNSAVSFFGAVNNPWDLTMTAGGSSSGSGAAVAAGFCYGALGSDTAGSVRIPASINGIVGLKPTYGLGPGFKSRRPDQTPSKTYRESILGSLRSGVRPETKRDPRRAPCGFSENLVENSRGLVIS
jgi:aspartyl-tRNA(Asn)/glutamyl-tRNA(Gln) amidotransferase subunit A